MTGRVINPPTLRGANTQRAAAEAGKPCNSSERCNVGVATTAVHPCPTDVPTWWPRAEAKKAGANGQLRRSDPLNRVGEVGQLQPAVVSGLGALQVTEKGQLGAVISSNPPVVRFYILV